MKIKHTYRKAAIALLTTLATSAAFATPAYAACNNEDGTDSRESPIDFSEFEAILRKAKFQYNTGGSSSSDCVTKSEIADGQWGDNSSSSNDYFYMTKDNTHGDALTFKVKEGDKARAELRMDSFNANTNKRVDLVGEMLIRGSYNNMPSAFTVAQLHIDTNSDSDSAKTSSPMFRLEFIKSRDGLSNQLWGIFRPDPDKNGSGDYEYRPIAIGKRGTQLNTITMQYNLNGNLKVVVNGNIERFGISDWKEDDIDIYYKAGCYTGDDGSCAIQYTKLTGNNF